MIPLTRLTQWALRTAAKRWPADVREELHREWQAELAHLEARPGTAGERLRFAFSLLTSPPVRDAAGVPRGWAEARPAMSPAAALMLVALLGVGVVQLGQQLWSPIVDSAGPDAPEWLWRRGPVVFDAIVLALWCVPAGWWLGRRLPMSRDGRSGAAGPALLAPLTVVPALIAGKSSGGFPLFPVLTTVIGVVAWTVLTALVGRAVARAHRPAAIALAAAGVPLAAVAATVLATVPVLTTQGWDAALASLLMRTGTDVLLPDASGWTVYTGSLTGAFIAFGWFTVVYGRRAAGAPDRPARLPENAPAAPADRPGLPVAALTAGVTAVVAGVLAWAYTVTYLTPAMPVMAETAPMPGGDGEIYLWVAELRWAAIAFTALGVLVATAERRSAPRAAIVVAAGLLGTESVLLIQEITGAAGLRIALLAAAAVIALGWALAGRPLESAARARTTTAAIAAAAFGPLLFGQSTPPENHPFLPLGLPLTTAAVAAGLVLLGTVTAAVTSPHRLRPAVIALLVGLPVATVAGLSRYLGNGEGDQVSTFGILLSLPLAVVVAAVLRRHRPRRRGRTAAIWTLLAVAGLPVGVPIFLAAVMPLAFAANMLFLIDGTGYPADGVSVLPGAALLILPVAALLAHRPGGAAAVTVAALPETGPRPVTGTSG